MPQIKDVRLFIQKHYTFTTSNNLASNNFIMLGILGNYLEKIARYETTLPYGTSKTFLDASPPQKLLQLHCKQIIIIQTREIGYHQACQLTSKFMIIGMVQQSIWYGKEFSLSRTRLTSVSSHLDFKLLHVNNNIITSRTFYLQQLNKECEYMQ